MLKITYTINTGKLPKVTNNSNFLTLEAKLVFLYLRQVFTKALILYYFDLERYIRIKTDAYDYLIGGIFCQLIHKSSQ